LGDDDTCDTCDTWATVFWCHLCIENTFLPHHDPYVLQKPISDLSYKAAFSLLSKSNVQAYRLYCTLFTQEVTFENKPSHLKRTPPPAKQSHGDTWIHRGIFVLPRCNGNTLTPFSTTWNSDNWISQDGIHISTRDPAEARA
jgi:hypothetical protein